MKFKLIITSVLLSSVATLIGAVDVSIAQVQTANGARYGHAANWRIPIDMDKSSLATQWEIAIGDGRSQIVGTENELYVMSGSQKKVDKETFLTIQTTAIDLATGKRKWSVSDESKMYKDQETFGGAPATPQATPAIAGDKLITVSFTGQLNCLDRNDGSEIWKKDLVEDLGAEPVQYGFASSPVVEGDRLYVLAAGKRGGLFCLNLDDGSTFWKSECDSVSYATPVSANFGGIEQFVIISENDAIGVSKKNGKRLWRYALASPGLTNVPSPLVVNDMTLLISGQGCGGTRCLEISNAKSKWTVEEQWHSAKLEFFYCNWAKVSDELVVGCTMNYLAAFDVRDGSILGRWRGYGNGNVALAGDDILVLDGKGKLSVLKVESTQNTMKGFSATAKFDVIQGRCWTPISMVNNRLLVRADEKLACVSLSGQQNQKSLANLSISPKKLDFQRELIGAETVDYVEQIFEAFQSKGQRSALKLYSELRAEKKLNVESRIALISAASQQGLGDVAKLIATHALKDFPDSKEIKSAAKSVLRN